MNTPMNIPLNVDVYCSDGLFGRASQLIVNPTSQQVTHLVVQEKRFPHRAYMTPVDQVMDSAPDMIKLNCTLAALKLMDPFIHFDTIYTDAEGMGYATAGFGLSGDLGLGYGTWQHDPGERFTVTVKTEAVPNGEVALTRDTHIHASDGQIGRLDGFLAAATTGQITHLLLREGYLWGQKDVTIPIAQIDHMEAETVYLKLDKARIGLLPTSAAHT